MKWISQNVWYLSMIAVLNVNIYDEYGDGASVCIYWFDDVVPGLSCCQSKRISICVVVVERVVRECNTLMSGDHTATCQGENKSDPKGWNVS